ncbi:MAG TPA: hypothetical protein VF815_16770 [Myxococcaceae bacterium]|jgi:hypothetical protein
MNGRQASGAGRRWSEALLGGVAGLGARVLLAGAARMLGFKSGPVAVVGGVAGLVGALVGGGLARRQRRPEGAEGAEAPGEVIRVTALDARWEAYPEAEEEELAPLRRGPNGRERLEYWQESSSHTA